MSSTRSAVTYASLAVIVLAIVGSNQVLAQISSEENREQRPEQFGPASPGPENWGPGMSGGMGKGVGGGMGRRPEAQEPLELYPELMSLPSVTPEQRARLIQQAHQRMLDGTARMLDGFDQLSAASARDDFAAMQEATATLRDGLEHFETGLATQRAIAEGVSPRNEALRWFKEEMGLLPPATQETEFRFLGMKPFHSVVCSLLAAFTVLMIWMYFFKMRRAAALLEKLAAAAPSSAAVTVAPTAAPTPKSSPTEPRSPTPASQETRGAMASDMPCCDESADGDSHAGTCPTLEVSDHPEISEGLLPILKRKLCRLRVARIYQQTSNVKTFRLVSCHGSALPFSYYPGQFLTLTLPVGEKPIRRSYTISSSPTQGFYCEITVKREEHGAGSRYLHDVVKEGDMLEVQPPAGKFTFSGSEADSIVLIGGGVGITPMMDIARALTDMAWQGEIYFIVACRDPESFIFAEELTEMQQREPNLHLFVAMSRLQEDKAGYHHGRLTMELLADWVPDITSRWIHLCGAPPMMDSTKQMLLELDVPSENIHLEKFGSQHKPAEKAADQQAEAAAQAETAAPAAVPGVTFQGSGKSASLPPEKTVLDVADDLGVDIDNSCRAGVCGLCKIKLLSGNVTMECKDSLEADEEAQGVILACQAKSDGDVVVDA